MPMWFWAHKNQTKNQTEWYVENYVGFKQYNSKSLSLWLKDQRINQEGNSKIFSCDWVMTKAHLI